MIVTRKAALALVVGAAVSLGISAAAQIRYSSGQNAAPIFEGWKKEPDGSISMVFGYLNRNYDEELDIPVGPDNHCEPAPIDCGQPTHFLTRRQRFVFKVKLAADWPKDRKLLWIITSNGKTDTARAALVAELEIDNGTIAENAGTGILTEGNAPPQLVKASPQQTITLPASATISASFSDDGLPKPQAQAAPRADAAAAPATPPSAVAQTVDRRRPGIRIRWVHYRGPGTVTFDPERTSPVYGKPAEISSKVTFSAPGTYVLRAIASDTQLEAIADTTVVVKASVSR